MDEEKKPGQKAGGVHAGHRHRIRQRFLTSGLEGFQDHEVLEFLLFYAVPRRDVNTMAHQLLNRFGTLAAVLDAPEEALCEIEGVGPHVARFLNLIPQVMVQMARQSQLNKAVYLRTPKELQDFLARRRPPLAPGQVALILTDSNNKILSFHRYDSFEALTLREIASQSVLSRASLCILAEQVADCTDYPIPGRLQALDALARGLKDLRLPLWDYFTVDDLGHRPNSYARSGRLLPR